MSDKENPKQAFALQKIAMSTVPANVLAEVSLAMLEGCKYGRHNYRVSKIKASTYYDANLRHMMDWWEGDDNDERGISHITKAIASLVVLRDAMMNNMMEDDRPPKAKKGWLELANAVAKKLVEDIDMADPFMAKDIFGIDVGNISPDYITSGIQYCKKE